MTADQYACTESVLDVTPDAVAVSNLGVASYVLAAVSDPDRARNVYQWGSMGVTTATGLGLALRSDHQVTVLEGDGSLLMSLGVLATVGRYDPANLTIILWNNGVYGTTGGQETHASVTDFPAVAAGCGVDAATVESDDAFETVYREAVDADGATLIDCHVDPVDPNARPPLDYPHIARRPRGEIASEGDDA